ncbi:hypothetical protein SAMN02910298_01511 [Pseudobutyrivibrio sp. YE44]|uniref:hypothetical protein n=1 Tax=Pseudobutyrivibrio sp. YE44 TaxID=1520802 RepID=UPI0008909278|nr:hypothetical protein [Pseudobutyrivibrio sp. YE44]SDB30626.1 hypothetical protein SAMN02910298_01511 [Pseudobutyrivibrio sp. YE44]
MAIAPISGINAYSSPVANIQPMNYAVENTAGFSDVYNAETTKQTSGVNGTVPVQYPNAKVGEVEEVIDPADIQQKTLQTASSFNDIAAKFVSNTSYSMKGIGNTYNMAGSRFDAYA